MTDKKDEGFSYFCAALSLIPPHILKMICDDWREAEKVATEQREKQLRDWIDGEHPKEIHINTPGFERK